jgi:hypothetical protein
MMIVSAWFCVPVAATTWMRLPAASIATFSNWMRSSVVSADGSPVVPVTTTPADPPLAWKSISFA